MKRSLPALAIILCYFSCAQKEDDVSENSDDFRLEIVDSLQIDYLGSLWIQDYDSISEKYIGLTRVDQEILIIDQKGQVTSSFVIPKEGPNSIQGIFTLSLRNSQVQIFDSNTGFNFLNLDGVIKSKIEIPYPYMFISPGLGRDFNSLGNEIAYLRPINKDSIAGGMEWITEDQYTNTILEVMDTVSHKVRKTMAFPQSSMYADGNFYFFPFPTVQKYADLWYLYFWKELKYFVYKENGDELILEKTVDLNVEDAVLQTPLPFSQSEQYLELTQNNKAGYIYQLYRFKGKTIVIYSKGIPEEKVLLSQSDPSIEVVHKSFAAVFDEENNLIKNDIPVAEGLIFNRAMTENGEILAMKNQEYFGVEEDFVIVYKLKLLN